jgi:hypothetical protein
VISRSARNKIISLVVALLRLRVTAEYARSRIQTVSSERRRRERERERARRLARPKYDVARSRDEVSLSPQRERFHLKVRGIPKDNEKGEA